MPAPSVIPWAEPLAWGDPVDWGAVGLPWDDIILWDASVAWDGASVLDPGPGPGPRPPRPNPHVPGLAVLVGFENGPYDPIDSIVWTDVTAAIVPVDISRGRQNERGQYEGATCSLRIKRSHAKDFDPNNTAGAYYPHIDTMNWLRVTATYGTTTKVLFTGYVWDWGTEVMDYAGMEARVQAADAFRLFNLPNLPNSPWEMEVLKDKPKVWLRLGESQGTTTDAAGNTVNAVAHDSSGNVLNGTYQGDPGLGVDGLIGGDPDTGMSPLNGFGQRASLPYKNLISGYPWTFECWLRAKADRARQRAIFMAYDTPGTSARQRVQIYLQGNVEPVNTGKVIAHTSNPNPTGTYSVSSVPVDDGQKHHIVAVMVSSNNFKVYVDGVDRTVNGTSNPHSFPNDLVTGYAVGNTPALALGEFGFASVEGDVIDEVAIYDGVALSPARIAKHYAAGESWASELAGARIAKLLDAIGPGWPASDRVLDLGGSPLQPAAFGGSSWLAYIQQVAESDSGGFHIDAEGRPEFIDRFRGMKPPYTVSQATFGPNSGLPYELPISYGKDDLSIVNDASGQRNDGIAQRVQDAASIEQYGVRTYRKSLSQLASDADVLAATQYVVDQNKTPRNRVKSITIRPHQNPAGLYPQVLGRKMGDRVTLDVAPPGCAPWEQDFIIEHIHHVIDPEEPWTTEWALSPADPVGYWILGTSALGVDTRLAY